MADFREVKVKQFTILLAEDECTCNELDVFPDGQGPSWFSQPMQVVMSAIRERQRWRALKAQDKEVEANFRYWAFHLEDRHVLKVMDGKDKI